MKLLPWPARRDRQVFERASDSSDRAVTGKRQYTKERTRWPSAQRQARSYGVSLTVGPFGPVVWHMAPKSGCLLLVFSMCAAPVDAHDIYMHLKTPLGFHCCTGQDCRPAHYRSGGDGIEMLVDNRWLPVAGYDVMYRSLPGDTGETFGGHWCGRNIPIEGRYITYCAVLPPNSAAAHVPLGTTPHSH